MSDDDNAFASILIRQIHRAPHVAHGASPGDVILQLAFQMPAEHFARQPGHIVIGHQSVDVDTAGRIRLRFNRTIASGQS